MNIYYHNGCSNICGTQVREKRLHLGLSQEQLAAQIQIAGLDITQRAVSRIETGNRVVPDYELIYLSKALDIPVSYLLGLE